MATKFCPISAQNWKFMPLSKKLLLCFGGKGAVTSLPPTHALVGPNIYLLGNLRLSIIMLSNMVKFM